MHAAAAGVDRDAGEGERGLCRLAVAGGRRRCRMRRLQPAQDCPEPGREFPAAEGLGDVVVGARGEGEYLVDLVVAGGEHDDRDGRGETDLAQQLQPVEYRHHDVGDDDVRFGLGHNGQGSLAVSRLEHLEAVGFEVATGQVADLGLVVDDKRHR